MSNYSDPLIFGKNLTEKIVSIEASDGSLELFIKQPDGSTKSEFITNKYWLLSDTKIDNNWIRLKGDLHYKWGRQFSEKRSFNSAKGKLKHRHDIYTISDPRENSLVNKGLTPFKGLQPSDLSVLSFDIETTGLNHDSNAKLLVIANTFRNSKGEVYRKLFAYDEYNDEGEMLKHWVNWVRKLDPDVLCGHNIFGYDLGYIRFIADKFNVPLSLGRDSSRLDFMPYKSKKRIDGSRDMEFTNVRCYGREIIDTFFLSMNFDIATKKYESYGLKSIIAHEGLEVKGRIFYDAATIKDNYTNPVEWEKIKSYASFDGDDALALFDLMIPAYFYFNQSVPKTFQQMILSASGSQLNSILVRSYLQNGHSIPKASDVKKFQAAISYGNPGIHNNTFKVDISAMYPSIIIQYGIYDEIKDPEGNYLKMAIYYTDERLKNKKLFKETRNIYYSHLEQAQKIAINSLFGLEGTPFLNFNNQEIAELITRYGREFLQKSIRWAIGRELIHVKIPKKTEKGKDKILWLDPLNFKEGLHEKLDTNHIAFEDQYEIEEGA